MRYYFLKLSKAFSREKGPFFTDNITSINLDNYTPVWTDLIEYKGDYRGVLEDLFSKFNIKHPKNYAASSMSIGDVVELCLPEGRKHFICCSVGWKEVTVDVA